jgi:hypothetical protein
MEPLVRIHASTRAAQRTARLLARGLKIIQRLHNSPVDEYEEWQAGKIATSFLTSSKSTTWAKVCIMAYLLTPVPA